MNKLTNAQKEKIVLLREDGYSYGDINKMLNLRVSKSTMSYICRGVIMSQEYLDLFNNSRRERLKNYRVLAFKKNHELLENRKARAIVRAKEKINRSTIEMGYVALVMLYWGEGGKWPARSGLYLGSSDYKMLQVYIGLLQLCFGVHINDLKARVQLRYDQDVEQAEVFWSDILNIKRNNFYPAYKDKRTKGRETLKQNYHGVCSITCKGADIQLELQAAADIINKVWGISSVG